MRLVLASHLFPIRMRPTAEPALVLVHSWGHLPADGRLGDRTGDHPRGKPVVIATGEPCMLLN